MRWWQWLIIATSIGFGAWYLGSKTNFSSQDTLVEFPFITVTAEIADTEAERAQGLSGRESLGKTSGMLFVFDSPDFHRFHMKDMKFVIDVIWLDDTKTVIDITNQFDPSTYPNTITSSQPARYVLEVPAGFASEYRIKIGDKANFSIE